MILTLTYSPQNYDFSLEEEENYIGIVSDISSKGVKLTAYHHIVPRSRMVELYLHWPICLHGIVLIKHRDNLTSLFFYEIQRYLCVLPHTNFYTIMSLIINH
jgi:hypothetical protein